MYQEIHPDTIGYMPISIARVKTKISLVIMRECSLDHHYYPKDKKITFAWAAGSVSRLGSILIVAFGRR